MKYYPSVKRAISNILIDYKSHSLNVILEDDFLSRIYFHLLSNDFAGLCLRTYIKTRILQENTRLNKDNKYDLVIGTPEKKTINGKLRNYTIPFLIAECKVYPDGFSDSQLSRRRYHLVEDIKKLNKLVIEAGEQGIELVILFFDENGWLNGHNRGSKQSRLDETIAARDSINGGIRLLGIIQGNLVEH